MTAPAPLFHGLGAALVTLFDDAGELDAVATADLATRLVEADVAGLLVAGTTGEGDALTALERAKLTEAVRDAVGPGVAVLSGTGVASRAATAELTAQARDAGADAAVVRSPAGVADPRDYYAGVVAAAGDLPVLAYHFPAVAPPGIPVEQLADLPVAGLKDSSGDPKRLLMTLERVAYPVYPGSAWLAALAGAVGCAGALLAIANAEPQRAAAAVAGDGEAQRALTTASETAGAGVAGIKALAAARFGVSPVTRVG